MEFDDTGLEPPGNRNDWHDAGRKDPSGGEATEFDTAVVIMAAERELMNARIAALQAGVDRAHQQLTDAHADMAIASAYGDADVVRAAKDYVNEVTAMFERVSTVNVTEMTAAIEQGLSNLEAAIALIPPAVEPPLAPRSRAGRDDPDTGEV
jgi:hypothetical protein